MKILITVDPEIPVPPVSYGGIERIADGLAKGYQALGHEVYLIANPNSGCTFTITNFGWPAIHSQGIKNTWKNMWFLHSIVKKIKPDVIHSFSRLLYGYPLFIMRKYPFLQSYQRQVSPVSTTMAHYLAGSQIRFTACAKHMIKDLPQRNNFTAVFNFTDVNYFEPSANNKKEYLFFLGRIEDVKGTREAIEVAIATGKNIIVAGNIQTGHEAYFDKEIKPYLTNPLVQYVGAVDDKQKKQYLQNAAALIFPIKWEEPFGIVMAESLACGVPVIGMRRGSVPEVIADGKNGFICNSVSEMIDAVAKLGSLKEDFIRADAVGRFSLEHITVRYIQLLKDMLHEK
ncbi:MAG: glycosyltransferase [Ferruginibacter sp.]